MTRTIQRSFAGGEVSPALYGRGDTIKYQTGLRTCRNFKVQRYGGVANRTGSEFVAEVKDSTKLTRLLKFVFNTDQTYVLEFGDLYMRVIQNGAQVTDLALTITGITQANPAVLTYTGTDPSNGQEVAISGVGGMTQVNGRNFRVANVNAGANTFELQYLDGTDVDSTGFDAYTSGGTADRVYEIATPFAEADLRTLQFVQSGNVVTITHPNYAPRDLTRASSTSWIISAVSFLPILSAPTGLSFTFAAGALSYSYVVTAVAAETYEESLASAAATNNCAAPSAAAPNALTWNAVADAQEYYVYRETYIGSGVYGFIGTAASNSFNDVGVTPDNNATPPVARTLFNAAEEYPSTVTYFQQRRVFANTNNDPEKVWTSRSGQHTNLTISSPIQDDDAVTFTIVSRQVNEVRHLVEVGELLILTSGAVWQVQGDADGVLKPTAINLKLQGTHGAAELAPVTIGNNLIYLQARGSIVRDLAYKRDSAGYTGKDLSIYAPHLFEGYQLVAWDYQEVPDSIVWAVRDDGTMLGLTYLPEHEVWGWHRHDTGDGDLYEDVISVPEGAEDYVYTIVQRTIGLTTKRYIERFRSRRVTDVVDAFFVDSGLTYDGRNDDVSLTMTLSGGVTWAYTEDLTLTASAASFTADDVDNAIVLNVDDVSVRCTILAYVGPTEVTVQASMDVPAAFQGVAISDWSRAANRFAGLYHLEGRTVNVLADGNVETPAVVTDGIITLQRPYSVVHAGLPITADMETLDVDNEDSSEIRARKKIVKAVDLLVESSRGIWVGPDADHLREAKQRDTEAWGTPTDLDTGLVEVALNSTYSKPGRVFVRQTDPLPLNILALIAYGQVGG